MIIGFIIWLIVMIYGLNKVLNALIEAICQPRIGRHFNCYLRDMAEREYFEKHLRHHRDKLLDHKISEMVFLPEALEAMDKP